ncbi:MAG: hypothetical protein D3926_13375 [Desulfobacteraceae bacterium]|nr:MAG: hypothetical protein D3926_13375 [Desulfobacteraceae bacterium]
MAKIIKRNAEWIEIDRYNPTDVTSPIEISGVSGQVKRVSVTINISHSFTSDLRVSLIGPGNQKVLLVGGEGGSGDHFIDTEFDDGSTSSITDAAPPFEGTFRPEESLKAFEDTDPNGVWTLHVKDTAYMDGGSLNAWGLSLTVEEEITSDFTIDVQFMGGLSQSQRAVVETAAQRWSEVVVGDLPAYIVDGREIDDVLIEFSGASIDGPGGTLGQAGPTHVRPYSLIPIKGIIEFDRGDLARMEAEGSLLNVMIHEIAHILGLGTIWALKNLLIGAGTANPQFTGQAAMREFADLIGAPSPLPVPVANTGGSGTREGHWRESVFGNELMTGYLNAGSNPLSRLTIASLEDLGHTVSYNAADPYTLPSFREIAMMGIGAEGGYGKRQCAMAGLKRLGTTPVILPESAMVK